MFRASIFVFLLLSMSASAIAEPIKFVRYPHISNDGQIAFSYHGDIWVADSDGTDARRLTAHVARDSFPRFSPDGKWIVYGSNESGSWEAYVRPADGGRGGTGLVLLLAHATGHLFGACRDLCRRRSQKPQSNALPYVDAPLG